MPLPDDISTFTLIFGPYKDSVGKPAFIGLTGRLVPIRGDKKAPTRLIHRESGTVVVPISIPLEINEQGEGSVGPIPHTDVESLAPLGFLYKVEWDAASNKDSPGSRIIAVPQEEGDVVPYDKLVESPEIPGLFVPIAVGPQGIQGEIGPQGIQGEVGSRGIQGEIGPVGPSGPIGPEGIQGEVGPKGDKGDTGLQGVQGPIGPVGPQGIQGDIGPQGPQGIQGTAGATGATGAKGDPGDLSAATINTGVSGAVTVSASSIATTRVWTLSGNVTITGPGAASSLVSGTITLVIRQAATGGPYTVTWPATLEWANDAPGPSMPTVANAELIVHLFWTGAAWRAMSSGVFFP